MERLEALTAESQAPDADGVLRPLQRIGLSATVRPAERVAAYLGGSYPVRVVAPPAEKSWDLSIVVPVEDMSDLAASASTPAPTARPWTTTGRRRVRRRSGRTWRTGSST